MPARYDRELVRRWFGESKKMFDTCTMPTKTLGWDDVCSCGLIFQGEWQGRDKKIVNLSRRIALLKGADEPVVLPKKIPLSKVLAGETKGLRQEAIKEAKAFAKRVGSGAEPKVKAKKGPKAPKGPPKKIAAKVPRGVALVEQAIAKLPGKRPLSAADVKKLTLDGKKLPPSLARWLQHDTSRVECFEKKKLDKSTLVELCAMKQLDIEAHENPLPDGDCYLLMDGADSLTFLYVGHADATGEYAVMTLDTDDTPVVILEAPGFDLWIAKLAEAVDADDVYGAVPKGYEPFMKEAARLNLGGKREIEI